MLRTEILSTYLERRTQLTNTGAMNQGPAFFSPSVPGTGTESLGEMFFKPYSDFVPSTCRVGSKDEGCWHEIENKDITTVSNTRSIQLKQEEDSKIRTLVSMGSNSSFSLVVLSLPI